MRGTGHQIVAGLLLMMLAALPATASDGSGADEIVRGDEARFAQDIDVVAARYSDPLVKIDTLENIASLLRSKRIKFETGAWKLPAFYGALATRLRYADYEPMIEVWKERHPESPVPYIIDYEIALVEVLGPRVTALVSLESSSQAAPPLAAEKIAKLRQRMLDQKGTASKDPHWYVNFEQLSLLDTRDEQGFEKLALEAVSREPTYGHIYDAATDYFLPKWGGSSAALDRWARTVSQATAGKPGAWAYARTYLRAMKVQYGNAIFAATRVDWIDLKTELAELLTEYPALRNVSLHTTVSCIAGDHREANALVARNPLSLYLGEYLSRADQQACLNWARTPNWYVSLLYCLAEMKYLAREILDWWLGRD